MDRGAETNANGFDLVVHGLELDSSVPDPMTEPWKEERTKLASEAARFIIEEFSGQTTELGLFRTAMYIPGEPYYDDFKRMERYMSDLEKAKPGSYIAAYDHHFTIERVFQVPEDLPLDEIWKLNVGVEKINPENGQPVFKGSLKLDDRVLADEKKRDLRVLTRSFTNHNGYFTDYYRKPYGELRVGLSDIIGSIGLSPGDARAFQKLLRRTET